MRRASELQRPRGYPEELAHFEALRNIPLRQSVFCQALQSVCSANNKIITFVKGYTEKNGNIAPAKLTSDAVLMILNLASQTRRFARSQRNWVRSYLAGKTGLSRFSNYKRRISINNL